MSTQPPASKGHGKPIPPPTPPHPRRSNTGLRQETLHQETLRQQAAQARAASSKQPAPTNEKHQQPPATTTPTGKRPRAPPTEPRNFRFTTTEFTFILDCLDRRAGWEGITEAFNRRFGTAYRGDGLKVMFMDPGLETLEDYEVEK